MSIEIFRSGEETAIHHWLNVHEREVSVSCTGTIYVANVALSEIVQTLYNRQNQHTLLPFNRELVDKITDLHFDGRAIRVLERASCFYYLIEVICRIVHKLLICMRISRPPVNIEQTIDALSVREDPPSPTILISLTPPASQQPALAVSVPAVTTSHQSTSVAILSTPTTAQAPVEPNTAKAGAKPTNVDGLIVYIKQGKGITYKDFEFLIDHLPRQIDLTGWQFPITCTDTPYMPLRFDSFCWRLHEKVSKNAKQTLRFSMAREQDRANFNKAIKAAFSNMTIEMEGIPLLDVIDPVDVLPPGPFAPFFEKLSLEQQRAFFALNLVEGRKNTNVMKNLQKFTKGNLKLVRSLLVENIDQLCHPDVHLMNFLHRWNIGNFLKKLPYDEKSRFFKTHFEQGSKNPKMLKRLHNVITNCENVSIPYIADHFHHVCQSDGTFLPQWDLPQLFATDTMGVLLISNLCNLCDQLLYRRATNDAQLLAMVKLIGSIAKKQTQNLQWTNFSNLLEKVLFMRQHRRDFVHAVLNEIVNNSYDMAWNDTFFILQTPESFTQYLTAFFAPLQSQEEKIAAVRRLLLQPGLDSTRIHEILALSAVSIADLNKQEAQPLTNEKHTIFWIVAAYELLTSNLKGALSKQKLDRGELVAAAEKLGKALNSYPAERRMVFQWELFKMSNETEFSNIVEIYLYFRRDALGLLYQFLNFSNYLRYPLHCITAKKITALFTLFWALDSDAQERLKSTFSAWFKDFFSSQRKMQLAVCAALGQSVKSKFIARDVEGIKILKEMHLTLPMLKQLMIDPTQIFSMSIASVEALLENAQLENEAHKSGAFGILVARINDLSVQVNGLSARINVLSEGSNAISDEPEIDTKPLEFFSFAGKKHPLRNILRSLKDFIERTLPFFQAFKESVSFQEFGVSVIVYEYMRSYSELWKNRGVSPSIDVELLKAVQPLLNDIDTIPDTDLMPLLEQIHKTRESVLSSRKRLSEVAKA